nr:MAG TPA: hypothetical protein [Caudoviricetes sp.]
MNGIYWMTVIGNLSTVLTLVWIVALVIVLVMLFVLLISGDDVIEDKNDALTFFKWLKRFVVCGVIAVMASILFRRPRSCFISMVSVVRLTISGSMIRQRSFRTSISRCLTVLRINILTNLKKINNYGNAHMV